MGINPTVPALARGLRVLRMLDGQAWRLEDLVRATALPRTSLARILAALEADGCVERTGFSWQAVVRLAAATTHPGIERWRTAAERLARAGWRGELWSFQPGGPVLVSITEPPVPVTGMVTVGWSADREEWMAPVQLWWAFHGGRPRRAWYRDGAVVRSLPMARIARDLAGVRGGGMATCPAANHRGIIRLATRLPEVDGCLAAAGLATAAPRLLADALAAVR